MGWLLLLLWGLLLWVPESLLTWLVRWLLELLLLLLWWLLLLSSLVTELPNQDQALKLKVFPEIVRDVLERVPEEVLEAFSSVCGLFCCFLLDLLEGGA